MRKSRTVFMIIAIILVLSACTKETASNDNNPQSAAEPASNSNGQNVPDDAGRSMTSNSDNQSMASDSDSLNTAEVTDTPQRVVTLLGSFCEEWLLAGGTVVGTVSDSFTNYDLGFDDSVADVGSHMSPDIEQILALEPDLVIASSMLDSQLELKETLEKAGITVRYFYVNSFEDYLASLEAFTDMTGRPDLYEKYGTDVASEIEAAKTQIDGRRPTVLFIRAAATSVKVKGSTGTVGGEILADLDTINIADSEYLLEDLSMEAIIMADPDYIFVTTQGSNYEAAMANVEELMINNPAWHSLKAVQNGNYYVIDKALYNSKPNARWGEAYQLLADIIYPKEQ